MNLPPRYINWRTIDGRKVPCRPDGTVIDPHDQANHLTREEAEASTHPVGFVLRAEDGLFFLDMDKCYVNGAWTAEASSIFESFAGAMGEVSQSGTGLHIIGRCDPSQLQDRRNKWDGWLEFYTDKRFIAFGSTGWSAIAGEYGDRDWTTQLLALVPQREHLGELPEGIDANYTGPSDDDELIRKMLGATNAAGAFGGVTVRDLWEANVATLSVKYPAYDGNGGFDHSSADAALMSHLAFWTGKDMPRMDRLFRRSALMRDKYEKREDYRRDTVQNAARLCNRVYDVKPKTEVAALPGMESQPREVFLTIPEMIEHFKGCVYVRDIHRVFVPDGSLLKPEQFNATYGGHMFQMMPDMTKPTKKAFEALTENLTHTFPSAISTCFRADREAGEIVKGDVNVFVPHDLTPVQGDVTPFTDFMAKLIPDERDRRILLSWCASLVQNRGYKPQWSPVLQGTEGNGKTLIARCLRHILGRQHTHEPRPDQLNSQFVSFDENKLLIIVEEIHMGGRRQLLDFLKPRITNEWVEVEVKGVDKRMVRNTASWLFCTNYRDAVIKTKSDRRYAIFFTPQQSKADIIRDGMDEPYFPNLYRWLDGGGYDRVAHYLLTYPIDQEFNPAGDCQRAPETSSTAEAIRASTGGVESEIEEACESERVGFRGGYVSSWAFEQLLKDKGMRISLPKRGDILRTMGYYLVGRTGKAIMNEGGTRPTIWAKDGTAGSVDDYLIKQGVGHV